MVHELLCIGLLTDDSAEILQCYVAIMGSKGATSWVRTHAESRTPENMRRLATLTVIIKSVRVILWGG